MVSSISARLDRLPVTSLHRQAIAALAFAYFFELADLNTFSYAAPGLINEWHIPVSTIALIISVSFGGMFAGATSGGWIADRIGRKPAFIFSILLYTLASLANAISWNIATLAFFRFTTGIGLSAMTVVANTYVGEVFPASLRGRYMSAVMTVGLLGIPATAWIARTLVPMAAWGWRLVFVWGGLGIFALIFARRMVESPRWLHAKGKISDAQASISLLENIAENEKGALAEPDAYPDEPPTEAASYGELFSPAQRKRTFILLVTWIFQTLGFYGFVAWVPTLLVKQGFTVVQSLTFASVMAICNPLGAVAASFIVDRFDRKWIIPIVAAMIAVSGLLYGLTFQPTFIVLFGALVVLESQMFVVALYVYTPELFPTRMRSTGHGLTYGVGRLANVAGPFFVSSLYAVYGYGSVFAYITVCWLIAGAAVAIFGPRTTGRSLEVLNTD